MEVSKYLLQNQLFPENMKNLDESIKLLKCIVLDQDRRIKIKKRDILIDIILRLVSKDDVTKICKIELLGLTGITFLLSDPFLSRQKYNNCFYCTDINYNIEDCYFFLSQKTKFRPLFFDPNYLNRLSLNIISDIYKRTHNINLKLYFQNSAITFDSIKDFNEKSDYGRLQGIIIKISYTHDTIVLKLLDPDNFIDTMKLYVTFKLPAFYNKYKQYFKLWHFTIFEPCVKQLISRNLKIVYSITYNDLTKITSVPLESCNNNISFSSRERIIYNANNTHLCSTELVNILPYVLHRGICKLVIQFIEICHLELRLFCTFCKLKNSRCRCIKPSFDAFKVRCNILAKNSDILLHASLKTQKDFFAFFDIDDTEKNFLFNSLKRTGIIVYKQGESIDIQSRKATLLSILNNLKSHKIIYGRFESEISSYDQKKYIDNYFEAVKTKGNRIYLNTLPPLYKDNQMNFTFKFKIKYVENSVEYTCKERFNYLRSKLLI